MKENDFDHNSSAFFFLPSIDDVLSKRSKSNITDERGKLIKTVRVRLPLINRSLLEKKIKVLEPSNEVQNNETIRFVAGLPTGIFIRCLLEGISDEELGLFRIQVRHVITIKHLTVS